MRILLIAIFGAIGTLARYALQGVVQYRTGPVFPTGTLAVNLSGCLLLGFLGQLTLNRMVVSPEWRLAVTIGFFGGYTTFSTFGFETFRLIESKDYRAASANILVNVAGSLVAAYAGLKIAGLIM